MGQLPLATQEATEAALDRLIDVVCPYTDGYVPDALRLLKALAAVPNGVETLHQLHPVSANIKRRLRELK